jgi:hypothetical protein
VCCFDTACTGSACCVTDRTGNEFCAMECTGSATCGGGAMCQDYDFGHSESCAGPMACGPTQPQGHE